MRVVLSTELGGDDPLVIRVDIIKINLIARISTQNY